MGNTPTIRRAQDGEATRKTVSADGKSAFVEGMTGGAASADQLSSRLGRMTISGGGKSEDAKTGGYKIKVSKPVRRTDAADPSGGRNQLRERRLENETESDAGVQAPASAFASQKWTAEQDDLLRDAVERNGPKNWKVIAESVPGRTHVQCLQRWKKVLQPGLIKGHWTKDEDDKLSALVKASDDSLVSWVAVAQHIPGRTAKQCRERWSLNLDPAINRNPWTKAEDDRLMLLHSRLGNKWAEISTQISYAGPGGLRTENAVKTRYKSLMRAAEKAWTKEEDRIIIEGKLTKNGRWSSISKRLPGRTNNAVRLRWKALLAQNPSLADRDSWDDDDDDDEDGEDSDETTQLPIHIKKETAYGVGGDEFPPPRPLELQSSEATTATYNSYNTANRPRGDSGASMNSTGQYYQSAATIGSQVASYAWSHRGGYDDLFSSDTLHTPPPSQDYYTYPSQTAPNFVSPTNSGNYYYSGEQVEQYSNYYPYDQPHQAQQLYNVEPSRDSEAQVRMRSSDPKSFSRLFEQDLNAAQTQQYQDPRALATYQSTGFPSLHSLDLDIKSSMHSLQKKYPSRTAGDQAIDDLLDTLNEPAMIELPAHAGSFRGIEDLTVV